MRSALVRDHREPFPVNLLCQILEAGTSGFYAWLQRPESLRCRTNRRLLVEIKAVHKRSRQTYGSPRVQADLNANGHACGGHRVARLMRTHGIVSRHKRKFRVTCGLCSCVFWRREYYCLKQNLGRGVVWLYRIYPLYFLNNGAPGTVGIGSCCDPWRSLRGHELIPVDVPPVPAVSGFYDSSSKNQLRNLRVDRQKNFSRSPRTYLKH
ncbi:MAG: IS3 family transposase [Nitrospirales bacterium]